uniref:Uncharacterized protein n=1 Tax=Chromera velia CCMP2878 TaxID=1169474 RepID=A0A0G4I1C6_9ALVE|mmetsp:Transcript_11175/g.21631  ORF Transcript_11175/g.21631 Transcript_11175/m.21631 type:complete len:461 (-) Transcript_11175:524-1906(-)|eukprot:Cvel_10091.t1-p1 / transcript=Cvel_10091.t1 / gene=Cvel_10091 / organism=Chromera_velia_CCMP2878 / gene_product=hypothetical protein / transcript_product=hypothetical protein / location=Cvel_scaffold601:22227-25604(-) / protein_length=460 / sequence_SO=supercontig / SO=protein_coding / is_pseudo=false
MPSSAGKVVLLGVLGWGGFAACGLSTSAFLHSSPVPRSRREASVGSKSFPSSRLYLSVPSDSPPFSSPSLPTVFVSETAFDSLSSLPASSGSQLPQSLASSSSFTLSKLPEVVEDTYDYQRDIQRNKDLVYGGTVDMDETDPDFSAMGKDTAPVKDPIRSPETAALNLFETALFGYGLYAIVQVLREELYYRDRYKEVKDIVNKGTEGEVTKAAEQFVVLGTSLGAKKQYEAAILLFTLAKQMLPTGANFKKGALNNALGNAYYEVNCFDQSIHYYRQAIRADPKRANYYAGLARALLSRGDEDLALLAAKMAKKRDQMCELAISVEQDISKRRIRSKLEEKQKLDGTVKVGGMDIPLEYVRDVGSNKLGGQDEGEDSTGSLDENKLLGFREKQKRKQQAEEAAEAAKEAELEAERQKRINGGKTDEEIKRERKKKIKERKRAEYRKKKERELFGKGKRR